MKYQLLFILFLITISSYAQLDSSLFINGVETTDTTLKLNMDATYDRPFLQIKKMPVSLGGYIEANSNYMVTEGITDGLLFQMRRMTIFMSTSIGKRIKFLTEIEFEKGTKEINIEFAAIDLEFHPLLNLRGGVIMNPIGAFNQNHDGPKWEFIDRPLSATTIIPSTFSNVGFGIWGKYSKKQVTFAYEAYLSNGFDESIIQNSENRLWIPAAKLNPDRFEESSNGQPLTTIKTAIRHCKIGEIGLSWMGGVYNKFEDDGIKIDDRKRIDMMAIDFNSQITQSTHINAEWVYALVQLPKGYTQQFGNKQYGGFLDIVQRVVHRQVLGFERSIINANLRLEYVDYNVGKFVETNQNIEDHIYAIVPGISFRPYPQTVIRVNYRYQWQTDLIGNPAKKTAGLQVGFSSYF